MARLLADNKLRQFDLCSCLRVSQPQVNKRIVGRLEWTVDEAQAVANFFGVPLVSLFRDAPIVPAQAGKSRPMAVA